MKEFGGPAFFIDRSDINTDEIIPAKYLTEISKQALGPHLLEDLRLDGNGFDPQSESLRRAKVLITRSNFGCGSSREHAVWALEVNDINVVIGESFARIFRQNTFNCGMMAIELPPGDIERMFNLPGEITVTLDLEKQEVSATGTSGTSETITCGFELNPFDMKLVKAGGWLEFADQNY